MKGDDDDNDDDDDDDDDDEEEEVNKDNGDNDDRGDDNGDSDDYIAGADDKDDNINGNNNYTCIVIKKMTTKMAINGKIWGVYTGTSREWGGERREKWISILFTVGSSPGNDLKIWNFHRKGTGKRSCLLGSGARRKFK